MAIQDLDVLYCEEDHYEEYLLLAEEEVEYDRSTIVHFPHVSLLDQQDLEWDHGELVALLSKENEPTYACARTTISCCPEGLLASRKWAVEWFLIANSHYGFTALTCVLAVNYFDRFISSFKFQRDKQPWMDQLAALACLSLAAKVEETQVPLLLDLQMEGSEYVFEAKTIQRMELLVLSAVKWKMHPVTPISYFDHIVRRLGLKTNLHLEFLHSCENLLLSVLLPDSRYVSYVPSVIATATMLYVIQEVEPCSSIGYQDQLMDILKVNKDQVDSCYELIMELLTSHGNVHYRTHKRKFPWVPGSPIGVIDMSFSCDNSNDSWAAASSSSTSSALAPLFKRRRVQDQQMRLQLPTPRISTDVLSNPH